MGRVAQQITIQPTDFSVHRLLLREDVPFVLAGCHRSGMINATQRFPASSEMNKKDSSRSNSRETTQRREIPVPFHVRKRSEEGSIKNVLVRGSGYATTTTTTEYEDSRRGTNTRRRAMR